MNKRINTLQTTIKAVDAHKASIYWSGGQGGVTHPNNLNQLWDWLMSELVPLIHPGYQWDRHEGCAVEGINS
jgi:hypothetical protein